MTDQNIRYSGVNCALRPSKSIRYSGVRYGGVVFTYLTVILPGFQKLFVHDNGVFVIAGSLYRGATVYDLSSIHYGCSESPTTALKP